MFIKKLGAKWLAAYQHKKTANLHASAVQSQQQLFQQLIKIGATTAFGKDHDFDKIKTVSDYQKAVQAADYEAIRPYINRVIDGERNVLWQGLPKYFNKTSGTTSGSKFIPMTKESLPHSINAARNALLANVHENGNADWVNGKMIFLSGSPELDTKGAVPSGRMSGIVNHHVPGYLRTNQLPKYQTNCIEDWEEKVEQIVDETIGQNMTLISGIPPWMQMYFDRLLEKSGKATIKELFPNLQLVVHGGVNFKPYRAKMVATIGKGVQYIETYPASEGFMAYQNSQKEEGLLLNLDAGIFYEFIPADEVFNDHPTRLTLADVELGVNYAIVLTTNAGLWSYLIGDTVKFVNLNPHKIVVTGRTKHFISAFGEHVIGEEVDKALVHACQSTNAIVNEYTVAPQVKPAEGLPYHEWLIDFDKAPNNKAAFAQSIDAHLQQQNSYYKDLRDGNMLRQCVVTPVAIKAFDRYMESIGKLGGQNKLPRLSNNRKIADAISKID